MTDGFYTVVIEDRHGTPVQEVSLGSGQRIVGRYRDCDIILPSENVSRHHARLVVEGGQLFVEDLNSANGVFVNGERIHDRTALREGSVARIGDFTLRVVGSGRSRRSPSARIRLLGRNLSVTDQVFDVNRPTLIVGRGRDAEINLPDPSVSRVHARLISQPDGHVLVEDMGSANGTFVNNQRVRIWQLSEGDILRFGNVEFQVEIPTADTVDKLKVPGGWFGRAVMAFWENLPWSIAVVLALMALVMVGIFAVGSLTEQDETMEASGTDALTVADVAPEVSPAPSETPDPLKEAMDLLARRELDEAARVAQEVLRSRPADPEVVKTVNRIEAERRARDTLSAAAAQKDPIVAAASLLDIPEDSIFHADARERLKTLLARLERSKSRACRAGKVVDCARLRGLVNRTKAVLVTP